LFAVALVLFVVVSMVTGDVGMPTQKAGFVRGDKARGHELFRAVNVDMPSVSSAKPLLTAAATRLGNRKGLEIEKAWKSKRFGNRKDVGLEKTWRSKRLGNKSLEMR
jgi:hypothetical protein